MKWRKNTANMLAIVAVVSLLTPVALAGPFGLEQINVGMGTLATNQDANALAAFYEAVANEPGFLTFAPAHDGSREAHVVFKAEAPVALPKHLLPVGWELNVIDHAQFERPILKLDDVDPLASGTASTTPVDPPLPQARNGIGPGSRIEIDRPDGRFGCTANYIWEDQSGNLYLGAAGHCFLSGSIASTNHPSFDPSDVTVRVCYSGCIFGGQAGFFSPGFQATLGDVVYARQSSGSNEIGHDFGIVEIPPAHYDKVDPEMPVWGGPTQTDPMPLGAIALHYGNAAIFGEAWPTQARAGVGAGSGSDAWFANTPSFQGDSGAAMNRGVHNVPGGTLVEGRGAVGALTHIVIGATGVIAGTTVERAKEMASDDANLDIEIVMAGSTIPP